MRTVSYHDLNTFKVSKKLTLICRRICQHKVPTNKKGMEGETERQTLGRVEYRILCLLSFLEGGGQQANLENVCPLPLNVGL